MSPEDFEARMLTFNAEAIDQEITTSANVAATINQSITDSLAALKAKVDAAATGAHRFLAASPISWDWRTQGAVTAVKNQGSCGSCWAFVAAANLEGLYYIKNKVLNIFSEQQMLDCDNRNSGCNGGNVSVALTYIKNVGGLQLTSSYGPYAGRKKTCTFNAAKAVVKVKGYVNVSTVETTIRDYLYANGPLPVAINAKPLQTYRSGILNLNAASCSPTILNHAVVIVGYGTENGVDYWILKNSWGSTWGEKGYFRVARGYGVCGMNRFVYNAVLA